VTSSTFAVTPLVDQYQASATVQVKPTGALPLRPGRIPFSSSVRLKAPWPAATASEQTDDPVGNAYVSAIRACRRRGPLVLRPEPSSPTYDRTCATDLSGSRTRSRQRVHRGGRDGGGDVTSRLACQSQARARQQPAHARRDQPDRATFRAALDQRGVSFMKNRPATSLGVAVDDRQCSLLRPNTVYLLYRTSAAVTQVNARSTAAHVRRRGPQAHRQVGDRRGPARWHGLPRGQHGRSARRTVGCHRRAAHVHLYSSGLDPNGVAHLFFIVRWAECTVYVAWSNDHDIFLAHSTDKGQT